MPPVPPKHRAIELNPAQAAILKVLARYRTRTMSMEELEAKCPKGTAVSAANLGFKRDADKKGYVVPGSLYQLGYVTAEEHLDGARMKLYYRITRAGLAMADRVKTITRSYGQIPPAILDGVVIRFRPTRTYGIDAYNDDDLQEIKQQLGTYAGDISAADLRQLIANRRKQGAYSDPSLRVKRTAKATLEAFGPGGWISASLLSEGQVVLLTYIAETGQVDAPE